MRKVTIFLCGFMLLTFSTKAQWYKYTTGQTSLIKEISVVDDNTVWVKDHNRQSISYTLDGGTSWTTKTLPANINQKCGGFSAVNATTAYIVVNDGEKGIYKTTDNADTWVLQPTGFNANSIFPDFVYFFNTNDGVAVGDAYPLDYFEIYTTSNGGEQWNLVQNTNMPTAKEWTFNSNAFFRAHGNSFYFLTNKGKIFKSIDKGLNWTVINTPETDGMNMSFDFKDDNNGILTFSNVYDSTYRQYITSNMGETWTPISSTNISSIFYLPSQNIYFSTNHWKGLSYSADDGNTWTIHPSLIDIGLGGLGVSNSGKIFIGGWSYVYCSTNYLLENTTITNVNITGNNTIDIDFSANVVQSEAEIVSNYSFSYTAKTAINVISATMDISDKSIIHLVTETDLPHDVIIYFEIQNINGTDGFPVLSHAYSQLLISTSIEDNAKNQISIFPNPSNDVLNITLENKAYNNLMANFYDPMGKLLKIIPIVGIETNISMTDYPPAVYFLKITSDNTTVKTFKIIKK